MASPIVTATPSTVELNPGGFIDVTIDATDPDSASGTATMTVADSAGNTTPVVVSIVIDDPLTFDPAAVVVGVSVTVTQIAVSSTSATYRIQA
jgi:hypothetical protein